MLTIAVNSSQVQAALARLASRLNDLRPAMAAMGQEMESRISARFETETDPNGLPWAPWLPSTRADYPFAGSQAAAAEGAGNGRILDRYGTLLDSLSHQVSSDSVRIGFGQPYAVFHEWGTQHMSRRGLLFDDPDAGTLSMADTAAVLEILGDYLSSGR